VVNSRPSSFTPVNNIQYPLNMKLGGLQSRLGSTGKQMYLVPAKTRNTTPRLPSPCPRHCTDNFAGWPFKGMEMYEDGLHLLQYMSSYRLNSLATRVV